MLYNTGNGVKTEKHELFISYLRPLQSATNVVTAVACAFVVVSSPTGAVLGAVSAGV